MHAHTQLTRRDTVLLPVKLPRWVLLGDMQRGFWNPAESSLFCAVRCAPKIHSRTPDQTQTSGLVIGRRTFRFCFCVFFILHHYSSMVSSLSSWFTNPHSRSILYFIIWLRKSCIVTWPSRSCSLTWPNFPYSCPDVVILVTSTRAIVCRYCFRAPYSSNVCIIS